MRPILLLVVASLLVLTACRTSQKHESAHNPISYESNLVVDAAMMMATNAPGEIPPAQPVTNTIPAAVSTTATPASIPTAAPAEPEPELTQVTEVDGAQARQLYKQNNDLIVLDVRTPAEYDLGHIPGALNFNFDSPDFAKHVDVLDKSRPYLVHCASGQRSTKALEIFKDEGFKRIYHLAGGLPSWKQQGGSLVPSPIPSSTPK